MKVKSLEIEPRCNTYLKLGLALQAESEAIRNAEGHLGDAFLAAADAVTTALDQRGRVCVTGVGKARLIGDKISATPCTMSCADYITSNSL